MEPADRLAALLRPAVGGLDRKAFHELLDAALDLAASATDADGRDGRLSQAAALMLARAAAGWTVPIDRSPEEWELLAQDDPARWREDAAACMSTAPAVVPQPIIVALMHGLTSLSSSQPPPAILQPAPRAAGRGKDPASRHEIEQAILAWIVAENAKGRKAGEVWMEAAAAVGRGVDALETWKREWNRRAGKERVKEVLMAAAQYGRGNPVRSPVPDEVTLLRFVASARGGALRALAESWNAAA
jgi:hypothetical protein